MTPGVVDANIFIFDWTVPLKLNEISNTKKYRNTKMFHSYTDEWEKLKRAIWLNSQSQSLISKVIASLQWTLEAPVPIETWG